MISTAGLVDFHCHLDLYPDFPEAIQEAEKAGIFTLAVTTTPLAWPRNHELTQGTKYVRAALGLHPQLVSEKAREIKLWERYLPEARYIGEVGLDAGPKFFRSFNLQEQVFQRVLKCCAEMGGKIISVHSVRASKAVLDHIEALLPPDRGKIVLHWFSGTKSQINRALEMGCYFSVNSAMLCNERNASMVQLIPLSRVLTETDGPFTRIDQRSSKPSDVVFTVEQLGRLHGLPPAQIAAAVRDNLRSLVDG